MDGAAQHTLFNREVRVPPGKPGWRERTSGGGLADMKQQLCNCLLPPKVLKIDANDETVCALGILENSFSKRMQGGEVSSVPEFCVPRRTICALAWKGSVRDDDHFVTTARVSGGGGLVIIIIIY